MDAGTSMLTAFEYVWARFRARLEGLTDVTDAEYLWGPVPVATIAWRIGHLAAMNLGAHGDRAFRGTVPNPADLTVPPVVVGPPAFLDAEYGRWRDGNAGLDEVGWAQELGPDCGLFATSNRLDLALHVYDELVHHAAEVGLRDLYGRLEVTSQAAEV